MDKVTRYRETIRDVIRGYAEWTTQGEIIGEVVEDPSRDHFELLRFG